nr:substrate-binding domain-containing protein [Pseudovibrio flavus]
MIGVAVHDIMNPYFAEVFHGLEEALVEKGKTILICNHKDDLQRQQRFIDTMLQHRVDGLIICPSIGTKPNNIKRIVSQGIPVTLVCRDLAGSGAPCVRGDDYNGSYQITKHLIEQGHKRIAMVGGRRGSSSGKDRNSGWRQALLDAGLNPDEQIDIPEAMTQKEGQGAAFELVHSKQPPTAVMCFNDLVALGVMSAARRLGIQPGPGLAVTGYDDMEGVGNRSPALTTVSNGATEIGELAAQLMLRQLKGKPVSLDVPLVQPVLRIRESAPPPGKTLKAFSPA